MEEPNEAWEARRRQDCCWWRPLESTGSLGLLPASSGLSDNEPCRLLLLLLFDDGLCGEARKSAVLVLVLVGLEVSIEVLEGGEREEAQVGHLLRHAREALIHDPLEDGCATRVRCRCLWRRAELSVEQALAYGQRERIGLVGQHALAVRVDEHLVVCVLEQLSEPHECQLVQARQGHARQQCRRRRRAG